MSLLSENIFPGEHGKVFGTDAKYDDDLLDIHDFLLQYDGIEKVEFFKDRFPVEIKIQVNKAIKVEDLKKAFKKTGFHLVDKNPIG